MNQSRFSGDFLKLDNLTLSTALNLIYHTWCCCSMINLSFSQSIFLYLICEDTSLFLFPMVVAESDVRNKRGNFFHFGNSLSSHSSTFLTFPSLLALSLPSPRSLFHRLEMRRLCRSTITYILLTHLIFRVQNVLRTPDTVVLETPTGYCDWSRQC